MANIPPNFKMCIPWVSLWMFIKPSRRSVEDRTIMDVSYTSFDFQKDDSYTGRGSVERRRRGLDLRRCSRVAVEQKFNTNWSGENAEFTSWIIFINMKGRMTAERFPHIALFGRTEGSRTRRRPRKKWLDNVKEDRAAMNLTPVEATRVGDDRRFWRTSVRHLGCQRTRTPSSSHRH